MTLTARPPAEAGGGTGGTRRQFLLFAMAASQGGDRSLLVRLDGSNLRVSAPQIRFLTGKPLEQLRNGLNVSFLSQLSMYAESQATVLMHSIDRFIVSYDLWEEKFSATRIGPPRRAAQRLTAPACETWCLDQLLALPPGFSEQRRFFLRFELRAEEQHETAAVVGDPGINITRMIEIFSRPPRAQQPRWTAGAGPLRLADLRP